jgi:uncharacterized protein
VSYRSIKFCGLTVALCVVGIVGTNLVGNPALAGAVCGTPAAATPIGIIQGTTDTAAGLGVQTIEGVVTADYETSTELKGFYVQDLGDGNAATSDGIFVYQNTAASVSVGDKVRVVGTVAEFQGQTQFNAGSSITICGNGGTVTPTVMAIPAGNAAYLEQFEGMLVSFPQELTVTEHFQLARFGQVLLSGNGKLLQPTAIVPPGGSAIAQQASNDLNQIVLDDSLQTQNPDPIVWGRAGNPLSSTNTLRGGDSLTGLTGVLTFSWAGNVASPNAWRVRPQKTLNSLLPIFTAVSARPLAPSVPGGLKAVSMNLLNFFNSFGTGASSPCTGGVGGATLDCRGADNQAEFDRQIAKTVPAVIATGADLVAFMEMENDGFGPTSAVATLVTALNASAGAGTYAFVNADSASGVINSGGSDAIHVGFIYKPAKLLPFKTFARVDPIHNRYPLATTFTELSSGAKFTAVANHFKSKSCTGASGADADQLDGQGCFNNRRKLQATDLAAWLISTVIPAAGDPDVLLLGDLNAYAKEDPITILANAGYSNQINRFNGDRAYSYVFDGQWGALDYGLANAALAAQVSGADDFHINSDEPNALDYNTNFKSAGQISSLYNADMYRVSDHDPVVIGLSLSAITPAPVPGLALIPTMSFSVIAALLILRRRRSRKLLTLS